MTNEIRKARANAEKKTTLLDLASEKTALDKNKAKIQAELDVKAKTQQELDNVKKNQEKQEKSEYISSMDIVKGTSLETKLLTELGSSEKVKEFMDKIDNIRFRAINNMAPGLDSNTAHTMSTAINAYFIEALDLSVKKGETKVEDVFGALKNMNFSSISFDGILGGFTGLFEKSTLLYSLTKNSSKIAKILRSNKGYIGSGKDIIVLNDPNQFKDLLKNESILKLEEKDIYMQQNPDLTQIFKKGPTVSNIDFKSIGKIYENHGQVLSQESVGKMVKSLNGIAAGADKVFPLMDQITGWIDNNGKDLIKKVDGFANNPLLEKLGIAGSMAGLKELINTILGFFGRDYDSIVKGDKQNFDTKEDTNYAGNSFSQEQFLAITQTYESVVGNMEGKCLREVRLFMQELHKKGHIDLPTDIDKESWGVPAKEFGQKLKNFAKDGLPIEWSEKGIQVADLSNKSDNPNDIYNTILPMQGNLFNIVMTKQEGASRSQAGHIAFASRVGQDIYIYDNSIKGQGDLNFVENKNGFSLARYIELMKGKYNFDSAMSLQSKSFHEKESQVIETVVQRKKYIFDFLEKKYDKDTAVAFIGNISQETGGTFDSKIVQKTGGGHGICQREGDRFDDLQQFAKSKNKSWVDLQLQLDFIVHELNGSEKAAFVKIKSAIGFEAKTKAISEQYERAGKPNLTARVDIAKQTAAELA